MRFPVTALATLLVASAAQAGEIDWKPDLKSGLEEAQKSGQAVFVVTRWKDGV